MMQGPPIAAGQLPAGPAPVPITATVDTTGVQPMAPAPQVDWKPGQPRPMTADQVAQWQERIARAERKAKIFWPQFERGLKAYATAVVEEKHKDAISALLPYRHVESKKAHMHHRTPDVNLLPVDPQDVSVPYDQILPLREKFLNYEIGLDGADMKRALHKTIVDAVAASCWLITEVGYEDIKLPVPPDPLTGQFDIDANGQPVKEVMIWSRRFIEACSSKRLLVPDDFHDTDFDKAAWLGLRGVLTLPKAKKLKWTLPEGFTGTTQSHEARFLHELPRETATDAQVPYVKVWYRASEFDETVFNPELYRCLILIDGADQPAWHVDSPFQSLTPQGQLTDDSMKGNPIHVDSLRDLPDSAYVPSDVLVGEQLSEEINRFRTGLARRRHKRQPIVCVNDELGKDHIDKVAENSGPVVLPSQFFDGAGNQRAVAIVQAGSEPRDDYSAQEYMERDHDDALGASANQRGQTSKKRTTATETRIVQGNSSARAETDRDRVREYVVRLIRKFDAIVQRTATQADIVKVLGQQGALLYEQWAKLPGKYAYKIQPDSGQYVDAQEYRTRELDFYNLVRKDPLANGAEVLRGLVRAFSKDAGKLVPEEERAEKPEPLKLSASISVDNAMALPAEMALLLTLLEQQGYAIPPELKAALQAQAMLRQQLQAMQPEPEHPGAADRTEPINKHVSAKTGGVQGMGSVS